MAFVPADGILARYYCEAPGGGVCVGCNQRGGGMYFFIGKEAPKFKFKVLGSNQRTRTIFTGIGVARELDACSDVPALEEHLSHQKLAEKISQKLGYTKWQRALELGRVNKIGEFWSNPDVSNQICNSIVLARSPVENCITGIQFEEGEGDEPVQRDVETHRWYSHTCPGGQNGHNNEQPLHELLDQFGRKNPGQADNEKPCDADYVLEFLNEKTAEDPEYKLWSDHCPDPNCGYHSKPIPRQGKYRPFEIVDGQHRTRGVNSVQNAQFENHPPDEFGHCEMGETTHHTNPTLCEDPNECGPGVWTRKIRPTQDFLPFTLLPWDDDQAKARVFTDITTRGRDMQPLHKLSMLWRFSLPDGKITQWGENKTWNFEGNSKHALAYLLCINLAKNNLNQTKGRIPPIITKDEPVLIGIESLFNDYILKWMGTGKILCNESVYISDANTVEIAQQINHYLNAWAYWLSGPMDGPDSPAANQRLWTPSHELWTTTAGAPKHPHFAEALAANQADATVPNYKMGHKQSRLNGGYFQTPANPTPEDERAEGKVRKTGLMWFVFDLLPLIVESILKDLYEANPVNDANPWVETMVSTGGSNILSITFDQYKDKLETLLKQYPFNSTDRVEYGYTPMEKAELLNKEVRRDIIDRIKNEWGWP